MYKIKTAHKDCELFLLIMLKNFISQQRPNPASASVLASCGVAESADRLPSTPPHQRSGFHMALPPVRVPVGHRPALRECKAWRGCLHATHAGLRQNHGSFRANQPGKLK